MTAKTDRAQRRELAVAVLACAAGAGLALYAGSRTWLVETLARPTPLGSVRTPRTGAALVPALTAAALVVLAGAGALLATRGWARRLVGGLVVAGGLTICGLALSALGRDGVAIGWVAVAVVGGVGAAAAGAFAALRGAAWPALGSRYERPAARPSPPAGHTGADHSTAGSDHSAAGSDHRTAGSGQVGGGARGSGEAVNREFWDALDRGEDPTKS